MNDKNTPQAETPKTGIGAIARKIFLWVVLGLVLFTIIMAASRKFGWF
jgi:hypothetical protein